MKNKFKIFFPLFLLSFFYFFFAFYGFDHDFPPGLNHDAACNGLHAIRFLNGKPFSVYIPEDYGRETLFHYTLAGFFILLGVSKEAIEITGIFFGFLSVLTFYYLLFSVSKDRLLSLAGSLTWACSSALIVYSRSGWRLITLIPGVVALSLFSHQYLVKKKLGSAIAIGLTSALILYTYNGGRGVIFFFPIYWAVVLLTNKFKKTIFSHSLASTISFIAAGGPMFWYAIHNFETFMGRAASLTEKTGLTHYLNNFKTALLFFNLDARGNDFFTNFPVLEGPVKWLWIIGFLLVLWKIKNYWHFILLLIIFLVPGVFFTPSFHRSIGTLPIVYFLALLVIKTVIELLKKRKIIRQFAPLLLFVFVASQASFSFYKLYIQKEPFSFGFYPNTTLVGEFIRNLGSENIVVYAGNWPKDSLIFNSIRNYQSIGSQKPFKPFFRNYQSYNTLSGDGITQLVSDLNSGVINKKSIFIVSFEKQNKFVVNLENNGYQPQQISSIKNNQDKNIAVLFSLNKD